jgi:hypothetical protein
VDECTFLERRLFDKSTDSCANDHRFGGGEISAVLIPTDHVALNWLADGDHRRWWRLRRNNSFAPRMKCQYQCNECRRQTKLRTLFLPGRQNTLMGFSAHIRYHHHLLFMRSLNCVKHSLNKAARAVPETYHCRRLEIPATEGQPPREWRNPSRNARDISGSPDSGAGGVSIL